jgi:hypothetical protein
MPKLFRDRPGPWGRWRRRALVTVLASLTALAVGVAGLQVWWTFRAGPRVWVAPHPATAAEPLAVGSPAADFVLDPIDGGSPVRLADLRRRGRPVVLVFSSFTCDYFTYHQRYLRDLYRGYGDRAEFLTVVVREAGHELPGVEFLLDSPSGADRRGLVSQAVRFRGWPLPTVLDTPDAAAEVAYRAFPLRVVVVNPDGRIAFATRFSGGGFGLDADALGQWFEKHLGPPWRPGPAS